jgi:hypothetical protein
VKGLFTAIVTAALVMMGCHWTCAFTILEFKPVLSDKIDPDKRETNFNRPARAAPIFVRSSFITQENDFKRSMTVEAPSSAVRPTWGTAQSSQSAPTANSMTRGDFAATSQEIGNMCHRLNTYMERLVHIYSHSAGEDKDNRLLALNLQFKSFIDQALPMEIRSDLEHYHKLCECIHSLGKSGLSLSDIYARRLCGQVSTKQTRGAIISKCRHCKKIASQQ